MVVDAVPSMAKRVEGNFGAVRLACVWRAARLASELLLRKSWTEQGARLDSSAEEASTCRAYKKERVAQLTPLLPGGLESSTLGALASSVALDGVTYGEFFTFLLPALITRGGKNLRDVGGGKK